MEENESTTHEKLWDAAKAACRSTLLVLNVHGRQEEKFQINDLNFHLK